MHHIGITVPDLEAAIEFYHDVLGLELSHEPSRVDDDPSIGRGVGVPGAALRVACVRCGESFIELIEYVRPDPPNDAPPPANALGAAHLAFAVEDIEARKRELEGKGIEFVSEVNVEDDGTLAGWRWVYFHDPAGNILELLEQAYSLPDERAAGIAEYERRRSRQAAA